MSEQENGSTFPVKGEIRGTGVIRDKDGNVKGSFTFGGPATAEEARALSDELKIPLTSGDSNGSDTDHGRS